MKKYSFFKIICCLVLSAFTVFAENTESVLQNTPTVVERGMQYRVWQTISSSIDSAGRINYSTNSFTELCSGICYEEDGSWYDSSEEIELYSDGAIARKAPHKVIFSSNLNEEGAIELISPEGLCLKGGPLGLAYYDTAKQQSVWIAYIQDCQGELYSTNQVLYRNAMAGLNCTVRYTYKLNSFEQDVILHEAPPAPEEYGFSSETTFLEVISDFQEIPEVFSIKYCDSVQGMASVNETASDRSDEQLEFGSMRMIQGKAFSLDQNNSSSDLSNPDVPVNKSFQLAEGQNILIEGVEYSAVCSHLESLPVRSEESENMDIVLGGKPVDNRKYFALPKKRKTEQPFILASSKENIPPGVVIDYLTVLTSSNMVFRSGRTYYVTGEVTLSGTTVLEGGAVIKYNAGNAPKIIVTGPVVTRTGPGNPVILTAKDDDSVGEILPNSTGEPNGYYGFNALTIDYTYSPDNAQMSYMRFSYLKNALSYIDRYHLLKHVQFVNCEKPINLSRTSVDIQNGLFYDSYTIFNSFNENVQGTIHGVNLTLDDAFLLRDENISLNLTNTLVSKISNDERDFNSVQTFFASEGSYTSVGAGSHYSENSSSASSDIPDTLIKELRRKTTQPPRILTGVIDEDTILEPIVKRNSIELGYHYDPIDYIVSDIVVSNATLTLTNGVVLGVYGNTGIKLQSGGKLFSGGRPERLNKIIRLHAVQERSDIDWVNEPNFSLLSEDSIGNPTLSIDLNFTLLSQIAGNGAILSGGSKINRFLLNNCQLYGGLLTLNQSGSSGSLFCFTNNLFDHMKLTLGNSSDVFTARLYNNTFYGSTNVFLPASENNWIICDNYFHEVSNSQNSSLNNQHDYNGYYAENTIRLTPHASHDQVVTNSVVFESGALGDFYYESGIPLINNGSRTAASAGLYHYTTQCNNVKEAGTQVDIGFHYIAVDENMLPCDFDGDGYPDYIEDTAGIGLLNSRSGDSGERNWQKSNIRLSEDSSLLIYTPLK